MKRNIKMLFKSFLCMALIMTMSLGTPISHLGSVVTNETKIYADEELAVTPGPEESETEPETTTENTEVTVLEEDEALREENKKFFQMSDGSMKACIYPQAVHYMKDGEYEEIDNTLELVEVETSEVEVDTGDNNIISEADSGEELTEDKSDAITEETVVEEVIVTEVPEATELIEVPAETEEDNIEVDSGGNEIISSISSEGIDDLSLEAEPVIDTEAPANTEVVVTNTPTATEMVSETEIPAETEDVIETELPDNTEKIISGESDKESEEADNQNNKKHDKKKNNKKTKPERKGSYYKNKSNDFTVKLPEEYGTDYTEFTDENGFVSFKLVDANKKSLEKEDKKSMDKDDKTIAKNVNDKGSYKSIKKNVDLEYDVSGNMLKETIVLNKKTKEDFTFEVKTSADSAALNEDGSVSFYDENNNKLYEVSAPYMSDAKGEYSKAIEVEFELIDEGYLLTYKPDEDWLYDKEREYPVRIDPTMFKALDVENITDTYVASYQNDTYPDIWGEVDVLIVGRRTDGDIMRSMIKFDIPSAIGANDCIIDAKLYLTHYFGVYDSEIVDGTRIDLHELTNSFTETGTYWVNRPSYDYNVIDYAIVDKTRYFPDTEVSYDCYNFTELANKWHNGETNNGLLLKFHDDGASYDEDKEVYYFAKDSVYFGDVTKYVEITYRNTLGLEDYWTYSSHNVGRAGTGYINLYNGNQVFIHEDVSNNTLINGFTLSHVYNSGLAATDYTGTNKKFYGNGWRLNLTQTLAPVTVPGNSAVKYVYTDGDGTKHYLVETDGKIVDEDGLGLTFSSISEGELIYKLTAKDGTIMKFDQWTDLRKIIDTNGNTISLNYAPIAGVDNYLSSITTSNGDRFDLSYDDDYKLEYVEDKAGRTIDFTYDDSGNLKRIDYPDGTTSTYGYHTYKLNRVRQPGGGGVNYDFKKNRVTVIDYVGNNEVRGLRETFTYNYCQTKVSEQNKSNQDIYSLYYQFDTAGRNTSVYDSEGNICASSYTKETSSSDGIFSNNKANIETKGTVYTENLLKNGTFVSDLDNWSKNTGTFTVDTSNKLLTPKSVKIVDTGGTNTVIYQSFSNLTSGTYTLSGYVKGTGISGSGGAGVRFVINTSDSGIRTVNSELITDFNDTITDNGFVRVSATVTLGTGESINRVEAGLISATGTVYVDSLQLEKGNNAGPINLIQNSSFETMGSNGTIYPYGFTKSANMTGGRKTAATLGNILGSGGTYGYQIDGRSEYSLNSYQSIAISGSKGDAYTFGGWAKAASAESHNDTKPFLIKLTFNNTDGTTTDKYIEYNTAVNDWQFLSNTVIADKDYSSLKVSMEYNRNVNTAYFDCLFLYRDTAASYVYDKNGNVISTADYATGQSSFDYSNNVLSKMVDPTGSGYEYFYDTKKNLVGAKVSSGNQTIISNSDVGLPTETRLTASDHSSAIEDGETYYIRLKGSGKYLTANGTAYSSEISQQSFSGTTSQQWKVKQTLDGYYTIHPMSSSSQGIDVASGYNTEGANVVIYAIFSSGAGDNQKFKIEPQSDYTYTIIPKHSTDKKKLAVKTCTSNNDVSLSATTVSDSYSWYFEKVEDTPAETVVSGTCYRIRAYHSGKYLDVTNNGTAVGTKVNQFRYNGGKNQQFIFTKYGDTEYYTIKPCHSSACLLSVSSADSSTAGYKYLSIGNTSITDEKLFKLVYDDTKRGFQIIPKSSLTRCLNVTGGSLDNSAEVIIYPKGTDINSYFILEECSKEIVSTATYEDNNSYLKTVTDSNGNTVTNNYAIETDLLTDTTDALENTTYYGYDENNDRLTSVSIENGYSTGSDTSMVSYGYNTNGSLKTITSPSGTNYGFTYDAYGRAITTKVGSRTLGTYTYRDNYYSLVSRFDYGNGAYKTYTYDDSNRLIQEAVDGSVTKTYTYDKLGNLAKEYDAEKRTTTTYNYDLSGRLTSFKDTSGQELSYTYDKYNRVKDNYFKNNYGSLKTGYTYGDNDSGTQKTGLIYNIKYDDEIRVNYAYDTLNRISKRELCGDTADATIRYYYQDGSGINTTTSLISKVKMDYFTSYELSGSTSDVYEYLYDENGNISGITKNGTVEKVYNYDSANQLVIVNNSGVLTRYFYDDGGNIDYVLKPGEGIIKEYSYDNADWPDLLTAYNGETITYDAIGNPIQYRSGMEFSWEGGRNLSSIFWNSGEFNGSTTEYHYDGDNYRRRKYHWGVNTFYSYIDGKLMSQRTGSEQMTFMYDENGVVTGFKLTDGTESTNYYYQLNIQGDVIGILNEDGVQVATYTYDEWGKVLSIEGSDAVGIGAKNPIRYRGYYYDEETGFYLTGTRYYDPEIGRFINADLPETLTADFENMNQYNLFAYCFNNPVNMSDETGTWPSWATKVIIGTVATAAAVAITVATGGAAAPLLIGVATSTLSGAAIGYITGGKEGAIEGAADGFMWGGIGALASSAVSALKAVNVAKQGVTIGEHMPSVKNAATLNSTATYKPMKGYNAVKKVFGQNVADKLSIYHNKVFIKRMRKLGAIIYDNGSHWSRNATSKWYLMEKQVLKGYRGLVKMY